MSETAAAGDRHEVMDADLTDEALVLVWGDGHRSAYPFPALRSECPCAGCRAEREAARGNPFHVLTHGTSPAATRLVGLEPVGQYGIRLVWGDGHQAGIYTFEHLREICPCEACRAVRPADEKPWVHGIYIPGAG